MRSGTATASRSASTSRRLFAALAIAALAGAARPAAAGSPFATIQGHLTLGYVQLASIGDPAVNPLAPSEKAKPPSGGSLGFGAGVDIPVRGPLRAGVDVGFDLLGSTIVESGSLSADVEYSLFEALALLHWQPPQGPWRVSVGPGLFHPRADLSSSGPVAFAYLAVDENAPGAALNVELVSGRPESLLRAGLEVGIRRIWLSDQNWTVALARLTVHY